MRSVATRPTLDSTLFLLTGKEKFRFLLRPEGESWQWEEGNGRKLTSRSPSVSFPPPSLPSHADQLFEMPVRNKGRRRKEKSFSFLLSLFSVGCQRPWAKEAKGEKENP